MTQLTAVDASFLNVESSTNHAHIAGLGVVDPAECPGGRLTLDAIVGLVRRRAHLEAARPLRRRLAEVPFGLDHPYWIDDPDFDPARHVWETALPAPGDDSQLAETVAILHERPLDRSRPLWELVLIQGLAGGRAAVYLKVHHAAIDGVLAAESLAAMLDLSPEPRELPPDLKPAPEQAPGTASMLGAGLMRAALHPLRSARSLVRAAPYLDEVPGITRLPGARLVTQALRGVLGHDEVPRLPPLGAPDTPFNQPIGRHRSVAFGEMELAEVKRIRRALGGSVNDVLMALCAAAVRRWLDKRGLLPEQPLVAAVPVSLRRSGTESDGGNQVTIMLTPLATQQADPADRYETVRRDMAAVKRRFVVSSGNWAQALGDMVPAAFSGPLTRLALQTMPHAYLRQINLLVSNVPGPQFPLYLCGARILAYYPISVVTDVTGGLNITVFSYDGKVDVGVVACRDIMPDPWELIGYLGDALAELTGLIETIED